MKPIPILASLAMVALPATAPGAEMLPILFASESGIVRFDGLLDERPHLLQ